MITINYSPSSIEDFIKACQVIKDMGLHVGVALPRVSRPVAKLDSEAVNRYCQKRKLKKYMRTEAGVTQGLNAFQDLKLRAAQGEPEAIEALMDPEDDSMEFPDSPNQEVPEGGDVY